MHTLSVIGICVLMTLIELAVTVVLVAPRWAWTQIRALVHKLIPRRRSAAGGERLAVSGG